MALAVSSVIRNLDLGQAWEVHFNIALSGTYGAGGESLASSFSAFEFKSTQPAFRIVADDTAGYVFRYDKANNKLMVFTSGANAQDPLVELSAGAYPAAFATDVITVTAWFYKK